jgi:hypothetical protein
MEDNKVYVPNVFAIQATEEVLAAHPELLLQQVGKNDVVVLREITEVEKSEYSLPDSMKIGEWLLNDKFQEDPLTSLENGERNRIVIHVMASGSIELTVARSKDLPYEQDQSQVSFETLGVLELAKQTILNNYQKPAGQAQPQQEEMVDYVVDEKDFELIGDQLREIGRKVGDTIKMPKGQAELLLTSKQNLLKKINTPNSGSGQG